MPSLSPLPFFFSIVAVFLSACVGTDRHAGDFVQTTDFHILQSFAIGEVELSGMEWTEPVGESLIEVTRLELAAQLKDSGFPDGGGAADFVVRANWHKALRAGLPARNAFNTIPEMRDRDHDWARPQVLCSLSVELYDPSRDVIFWRAKMPDCLEVLRLNQENVVAVIQKAMAAFPQRIQMDPDLGTIQ
jgi:hypothetical protein